MIERCVAVHIVNNVNNIVQRCDTCTFWAQLQYCSILLTTINKVGSKPLFNLVILCTMSWMFTSIIAPPLKKSKHIRGKHSIFNIARFVFI